jgi:hypothetical protein
MDPLSSCLQRAYGLLEKEDDWDDDGANKANIMAFTKAMLFMNLLIIKVGFDLSVPDIDLMRDGSTYIEFMKGNYGLVIVFREDGTSCYGSDGFKGDEIRSKDIIMEDIINWCKRNLLIEHEKEHQTTGLDNC